MPRKRVNPAAAVREQTAGRAVCHDCFWVAEGKGARRAAAQHHRRQGHSVAATLTFSEVHLYLRPAAKKEPTPC